YEITLYSAEERLGEIFEFLFADAGDLPELTRGRGITACHLAKRHVRENYVRRHVAFVGEFAAQDSQAVEQRFVAFDRAGASFLRLIGNFDLLRQCNWGSLAQSLQTGVGEGQRSELARGTVDKFQPQKLAPDCLPGVAFQFPANPVSR